MERAVWKLLWQRHAGQDFRPSVRRTSHLHVAHVLFAASRDRRQNRSDSVSESYSGQTGIGGRQTISLPGQWSFDAAISKSVRITESTLLQVRFDSTNILNHPGIASPTLDINNTNGFGLITAKDGSHREFRAR
jgi:hypothetical protein